MRLELYHFLCNLQSAGRGVTNGKQLLQALNFIFHSSDADKKQLAGLMTTRVKGVADSMMTHKPQLQQAIPLTTDIVFGLENLMFRLREQHHVIICRHLLFCIYSCARFGDTVFLTDIEISTDGGIWLIESFSKKYKMGISEKKSRFLPLVALGRGLFTGGAWGNKWFEARAAANLPPGVTMPGWSEASQCWLARPMATGEAITFLRVHHGVWLWINCTSLHLSQCEGHDFIMAAKSNMMDFESRRLLGHHLAAGAASVLTYARDEMVRLQHTVHKILRMKS